MFYLYLNMQDPDGDFFLLKPFATIDECYRYMLQHTELEKVQDFKILRDVN